MTERLFVYGTLQPGGPNEHVLADITGEWHTAYVKGRLVEDGWGASMGYPALVVDEEGGEVHGQVLTSNELVDHWARLDAFEGDEYQRTVVTVTLTNGETVDANVYVMRTSA